MTYFEQRIKELKVTEEQNTIELTNFDKHPIKVKIFSEDRHGNIEIKYFDENGEELVYITENKKIHVFTRKRLKNPIGTNKYFQPPKTDIEIFITPIVVQKVKAKEQIDTLYITEGEFKAFSLYQNGFVAVGIGGIHNFKQDKNDFVLHPTLINVIQKLKPKNIQLLFDADCLEVEWEENKDLYKRLNIFYTAVRNFNEMVKPFKVDLYFSHIKQHLGKFTKGIDDLFNNKDTEVKKLKKELSELATNKNREYINTILITGASNYNIQQYFCVDNVQTFFNKYKDVLRISDNNYHDFVYKNESYFVDQEEKLRVSWFGEASNYIRVGCDYYKKILVRNAHGKDEQNLLIWQIGEIKRDYKSSDKFINSIKKYDAFCVVPEHNPEKYKRTIAVENHVIKSVLYNRYHPIEHKPTAGEWNTIKEFLNHIFSYKNTKGETLINFIYDYIKLRWENPTQRVPVLCLVSKERNTGKSTFLEFLRLIFKENCTILDNERFTGKFTSHYTDKIIVGLDEGFIPVEQKLMKERIKNLSTGKRQWLEAKGKNAQEIDNISSLVMCSNDEKNFMQIDDGENRFAVIKVNQLSKDNPLILSEMEKEIPHFLHFIENRQMHYQKNVSRFYFPTDVYETEAKQRVIERTKSKLEKEIEELLKDCFINYEKEYLHFTPNDICTILVNERNYKKADTSKIKEYLTDCNKCKQVSKKIKYKIFDIIEDIPQIGSNEIENKIIIKKVATSRPFEFYYKDWLTPSEIDIFENKNEILEKF